MFGIGPRSTSDPLWEVAARTQIFTADEATVARLCTDRLSGDAVAHDGVLVAQRHPTGWFVHGVRSESLGAERLALFRELVTVRAHLLLTSGPHSPTWLAGPTDGEWRSPATAMFDDIEHAAALVH